MGKSKFFFDICRNLDQMEQEICSLCSCFKKEKCIHGKNCKEKPPPICKKNVQHIPPTNGKPPCEKSCYCCQGENN